MCYDQLTCKTGSLLKDKAKKEETTSLPTSSFSFLLAAVRVFQPNHVYMR